MEKFSVGEVVTFQSPPSGAFPWIENGTRVKITHTIVLDSGTTMYCATVRGYDVGFWEDEISKTNT